MRCPRCHHDNRPSARYCEKCGARVLTNCPTCRSGDIAGKNFCPVCGTNLKLAILSMSLEDNHPLEKIDEMEIDAELEIYKREVKEGHTIITCPRCGVKNRLPRNKVRQNPRCGKCGRSLQNLG